MASIVAEALLSASVEVLVDKIVSGELRDYFRRKKLDVSLLEKLKTTLLSLKAVLNDAEEKQITNDAVKQWLDSLRDVIFEADDLFDEINTKALQWKVEGEYHGQIVGSKVRNILSCCTKSYGVINSKMQMLFQKLEHFEQKIHVLKLKSVSNSSWHRTPTSSVTDDSAIYGRDGDITIHKEYLLSENNSDNSSKVGVIPIVGMGGVGKTTLAKILYNDPKVKDKFDLKGWAYISKDFDVVKVTKTLLESVTTKATNDNRLNDTSNLDTLQVQLQQCLSHKRYLLVLDDIWEENYVDWSDLKDIFNVGDLGSKIIITTRDERVALAMQTFLPIHKLEPLQSGDCWSLLAKHAFGASNYEQRTNLEVIGEKIAKKCDGLPLAAVALGGLLRTKSSPDDWNKVLKNNIWDLPNIKVKPALQLSYHYLPSSLKRCFAYCSIFPKKATLERNMVVQLWIAEGLVSQPKGQRSWEMVGEEYFDELVSRSLIHRRSVDGETIFDMHDLMNDLATMVSSPYCIRLDEQKPQESLEKVRHLSYTKGEYDSYKKFDKLYGLKDLRTVLALSFQRKWTGCWLSNTVVHNMFSRMKQVRVLSLSNYRSITELPNSIVNLIYLRYLNLSNTKIKSLPLVTCKLYNLQTLLLSNCRNLTELPEDIGKLVNLRHLDITNTNLKEMPVQIARLDSLQTLSNFVVGKQNNGLKVAEIGKFPHLRGKLCISDLQNVTDPYDALQANLKTKEQIQELELKMYSSAVSHIQSAVLEQLRPSTNLKKLRINGYGGTNFPNWLCDSSLGNMVSLNISFCDYCSLLPPLGRLHSLKELYIKGMKSVKSVGAEFFGTSTWPSFQPFPSLETLHFREMWEWEEFALVGGTTTVFPSLTHLSMIKCPRLKGNIALGQLGNLKELIIEGMKSIKTIGTEFYGSSISSHSFQPFPLLETLHFKDMQEWEEWKLIGGTTTEFPSLTHLTLENCLKLKGNIPDKLPSLTELELRGCPLLVESRDSDDNSNIVIKVPSDVFSQLMLPLNSLRKLSIGGFPSLTSFPRVGLPKTLQSLTIYDCKNLNFLPRESLHNYTSLEDLKIYYSCDSMISFTLGSFPVLKFLHIELCENLKWISVAEDVAHQSLAFLSDIIVRFCDNLESISPNGLPTPNLLYFEVFTCDNLHSLPKAMNTLASLQVMLIDELPNLNSFPMDGLPINLRKLSVVFTGGILWNTRWEHLNCLSALRFNGDNAVKALKKMEGPLLPASLLFLHISFLEDTECLDGKWLQHLTSLQRLTIYDAPYLKSLSEEGLPSSLLVVSIYYCPLLEATWRSKRGKEWRKIAHIPFIFIDGKMIT